MTSNNEEPILLPYYNPRDILDLFIIMLFLKILRNICEVTKNKKEVSCFQNFISIISKFVDFFFSGVTMTSSVSVQAQKLLTS